jgi:hypothetical protein
LCRYFALSFTAKVIFLTEFQDSTQLDGVGREREKQQKPGRLNARGADWGRRRCAQLKFKMLGRLDYLTSGELQIAAIPFIAMAID